MEGINPEDILVNVIVLVFSVVVHEVAHGAVALRYGDETALRLNRLTLNPLPHIDPIGSILVPLMLSFTNSIMFGWAKPVPVDIRRLRNPRNDHPKVAAAGPASNLLLALICTLVLGLVWGIAARSGALEQMPEGASPLKFLLSLLQTGILVNMVLALFNLIPLPPLDGSWILTRFLPAELQVRYEALRRHGFLLVIAFLLLMRYTPAGEVFSGVIMGAVDPVFRLAVAIARLIAG